MENPYNIVGSLSSRVGSIANGPSNLDKPLSCHDTQDNGIFENDSIEPGGQSDGESADPPLPEDDGEKPFDDSGSDPSLSEGDVDDTSTDQQEDKDFDDESFEFDFGDGHRDRPRDGKYVPGKRPLVDFFIKLLELFRLTAESKFIASRPRYRTSQYSPNTSDNYKR